MQNASDLPLPVVGIYTCLYCDRSFAVKINLKRHYRETHFYSIPDYRGIGQSVRGRQRFARKIHRIAKRCRSIPVAATQLVILAIALLLYCNA